MPSYQVSRTTNEKSREERRTGFFDEPTKDLVVLHKGQKQHQPYCGDTKSSLLQIPGRFSGSTQVLPVRLSMRNPASDQIPSILPIGPPRFERNIYLSKDISLA
jgi:hypothetical protein